MNKSIERGYFSRGKTSCCVVGKADPLAWITTKMRIMGRRNIFVKATS